MSDNDKVICPNCVHEFVAVPVNVQATIEAMIVDHDKQVMKILELQVL